VIPTEAVYDRLGRGYGAIRQADPRLAEPIWRALESARTVLNVGAGAGSYEPPDREVVAVEPSAVMIAQRPPGSAPVVQATAEQLPFDDDSFDAVMAVLTLQHWDDVAAGLAEMVRVAGDRVVIVTYDPERTRELWITRDYLPEAPLPPSIDEILEGLPPAEVRPLPVPNDCSDRMFQTLWARPEEHLDPGVRAATSIWHLVPRAAVDRAVSSLKHDLATGKWDDRHGHLRTMPEYDVGLRLIRVAALAEPGSSRRSHPAGSASAP
jgi:SAM-dependent methyltransferase